MSIAIGLGLRGATDASALAVQQVEHVRATLFHEASEALRAARTARADLLAPEAFDEGLDRFTEAEEDFDRGKRLEDIRRKLSEATKYFREALEATRLAEVTLATALAAREDAHAAEAPRFADERWREAEKKFNEAARKLEDGDVNGARKRAEEAEERYRSAELAAIKTHYLNETWELLEQAEEMDVEDRAPRTLKRAEDLVATAERKLSESRYDTDEPRSLAREAKYEAQHAIWLSETFRAIRKDEITLEEYVLGIERELARVANAAGVSPAFDRGFEPTTSAVVQAIQAREDSLARLVDELKERERRITTFAARVAELEGKVGDVETEKSALAKRLEAQAELRRKFVDVERLFSPENARVLRERDDVIVRLHGLTFPVGSAVIEPKYFSLLTHVQRAIDIFPGCTVTIEGHTDSFGGDAANLKLSEERAEAVRQYLLANMGIAPDRVEAVGHGESRPIATNETAEGRKRNRRIDVIIHP